MPVNVSIKTVKNLEDFITTAEKNKLVVVCISATWCSNWESIGENFRKLSDKFLDDAVFVDIDYDEMPDVARKFRLRYLPTFIVLKTLREVARVIGSNRHDELERKIVQNKFPPRS